MDSIKFAFMNAKIVLICSLKSFLNYLHLEMGVHAKETQEIIRESSFCLKEPASATQCMA